MENFDLVKFEEMTPAEMFVAGALDPIIAAIKNEVDSHVPDLTTAKGRTDIVSLSFKVRKARVRIENAAKVLTEDWRQKTAKVNAVKKDLSAQLDEIAAEARKPVDEWEAEQERIKEEERKAAEILTAHMEALVMHEAFLKAEADRIELEKRQAELEAREREIQEREEALLKEKQELEWAEENKRLEAMAAEEAEKDRLLAEERKRAEEEARKLREAEIAEQARLDALEEQRKREEQERLEQQRREENKRIVTRTHNGIVKALMDAGATEAIANKILKSLIDGQIPKVTITY